MKIHYTGELQLGPATESWLWSSGSAADALADLARLLETTPGHVDGLLKEARLVRTAAGGDYAAEFAVGPVRTLLVHYTGRHGYRWVLREGTSDASPFYREYGSVYARLCVARQRHDELLQLQEQLGIAIRAAEMEKQAAFEAWERAGEPREKGTP
jgi:hypothetical protein